jgi:diguanylate cyclase (GGDEF)-like protein
MTTFTWPRAVFGAGPRAWSVYLTANIALGVLYFVMPSFGATDVVVTVVYLAVCAAAPVAMLYGLRRFRPQGRRGWLLLAIGQFIIAAAEASTAVAEYAGDGFEEPAPSDVLYLSAYPILLAALLTFVRRRTPQWDTASALDAAIIAVSAGLVSWFYVVQPLASGGEASTAAKAVQTGYPLLDLLLLVVTVRLLLGAGVRTASFFLLIASIVLLLAADTGYAVLSLLAVDQFVSPLDAVWMGSYALMGTAALHPSMRRVDERSAAAAPDAGLGRLTVLAVAVLIAPGVQLLQHLRNEEVSVPLVAGCCAVMFLLVMVRMAGMVSAQRIAAITDGLTGLKTRRYLEQCLATETQRSVRTGQPLGLVILDVDHFKKINDTYGHPGGDRVLIEIARRLTLASRAGTVVARYGGEEFVLLMPHTGPGQLANAAEQVRQAIANTPIAVKSNTLISVTVSIGASCFPDHASADTLVQSADYALYAAKEAGRNRTVVTVEPQAGDIGMAPEGRPGCSAASTGPPPPRTAALPAQGSAWSSPAPSSNATAAPSPPQ